MQKDGKFPPAIAREARRMIILYAASIIEAVLLYFYKKKSFSSFKLEYKDIRHLPQEYQHSEAIIVLAKQIKKPRLERELMLDTLLKFFQDQKIINDTLAQKINKAKDVRNTFHLSKSRKWIGCSNKMVEISNEAVFETLVTIRDLLSK